MDGESVYRALEEFKCDSTAAVPTVFLNLLDYMAAEKKQLHHMKMLRVGGAACPPKLVTKFSRYRLSSMPELLLWGQKGKHVLSGVVYGQFGPTPASLSCALETPDCWLTKARY